MKSLTLKTGLLAVAMATLFTGCSDDDTPGPGNHGTDKYVLITMSENNLNKPGFATAFDALPTGSIVNNSSQSKQGMGFGGWRPYGNWLLKMFSMESNALGIERLKVDADRTISSDKFIATADNKTNGSGNFAIVNETSGYYWDGAKPLAIQTFNPTAMSRTGEIDLTAAVNERGENEADIKFRSIGQKFLAVKGGKLYANITYAKTDGPQKGFWDDFYEDVYIAVIDIATNKYEKTIKIEDTGSIAYINDNHMYDFDTNGDLYIVTQGRSALGGKSKISRIKANETDVDKTWGLNMDDIQTGGKFVSVFAKDGKIITVIPNTALIPGGEGVGNINFEDIWEFYSIDIASKARTKISGIPAVTNPGAAFCAIEIDGKVLLRVNTKDGSKNGYYQLNGTQATELFNVTAGGSVSGLYKITVEN
ncbi:hypothetical protein [Sphingobacterium wenxiniae]|uniref:DUF4374 domain-containing protein n=1 Tax=Sphingobacterium wenxiniae TaxID=683125 RepID=A0A1I6NRG3_9SPHI|nr:hypothetical protein [Sphingobacterium wenxiniae]SFS30489.1 hypothetical protein SAMN05660206_10132 [Sphingobacterium wenxiniae]